jgi:hypothetical protein
MNDILLIIVKNTKLSEISRLKQSKRTSKEINLYFKFLSTSLKSNNPKKAVIIKGSVFIKPRKRALFNGNNLDCKLLYASQLGCLYFIQRFYKYKSDIDDLIRTDMIYNACAFGYLEIIKHLNQNIKDEVWTKCQYISCAVDNAEILDYITDIMAIYELYLTELNYIAIGRGNLNILKFFEKNDMLYPNYRNIKKAIKRHHFDVIKFFLDRGNIKNDKELLIKIIKCNQLDIVKYLCERNTNLFTNSVLKIAIEIGHKEIIDFIVQKMR